MNERKQVTKLEKENINLTKDYYDLANKFINIDTDTKTKQIVATVLSERHCQGRRQGSHSSNPREVITGKLSRQTSQTIKTFSPVSNSKKISIRFSPRLKKLMLQASSNSVSSSECGSGNICGQSATKLPTGKMQALGHC